MISIEEKKSLSNQLGKLDRKQSRVIYDIIIKDTNASYTTNDTCTIIDVNSLSENTFNKINSILNKNSKSSDSKIKFSPYSKDEFEELNKHGSKLSNQEKAILKRIKNTPKS